MPMDLRQLKYFLTVAEELHFGRAAARVGIEQSPFSKTIKDLESDLGVRLFARTTRRTELTPAGKAFLIDARCVLAAAERATRNLTQQTKPIDLGIEFGLDGEHLVTWLTRWRKRVTACGLHVTELSRAELLAHLEGGVLDGAMITAADQEPDYERHLLWRDPWIVLLPQNHRLATRPSVSLADLTEERVFVSKHAADHCASLNAQTVSPMLIVSLVTAGYGLGIISRSAASSAGPQTVQRPVAGKLPATSVSLVWPKELASRVSHLVATDIDQLTVISPHFER